MTITYVLRGLFGLPIERTLGWKPTRMSVVMNGGR